MDKLINLLANDLFFNLALIIYPILWLCLKRICKAFDIRENYANIAHLTLLLALPGILIHCEGQGVFLLIFLTMHVCTLYLRSLTKPLLAATVLFQAAQLMNIFILGSEIYNDQLLAAVMSPYESLTTATHQFVYHYNVFIGFYLFTSFHYLLRIKPLKYKPKQYKTLKYFLVLSLAFYLTNYHQISDKKHPIVYALHALTGVQDNLIARMPEPTKPVSISDRSADKVIFIIGEAQHLVPELHNVMPNISQLNITGELVLLNDVTPLGNYTAVVSTQLIESVPIKDFMAPHSSFLSIGNAAKKQSKYVSSRNLGWGNLEDYIGQRHQVEFEDCRSVSDCTMLQGIDDMTALNKLVLPFIQENESYFLTWQMNGSHSPLHNKSPEEFKIFENEYLNSLHYTDYVLNELFSHLDKDTWVIFVSDHANDYGRLDTNHRLLSFIKGPELDYTMLLDNSNSRLTQLNVIDILFTVHGLKPNSDRKSVLTDIVINDKPRGMYRSLKQNSWVRID